MAWQVFEKVHRCKTCGNVDRTGERQVAGRRAGKPDGPVSILKTMLLAAPHPCSACSQETESRWLAGSGAVVTANEASDLARAATADDPAALEVIATGR